MMERRLYYVMGIGLSMPTVTSPHGRNPESHVRIQNNVVLSDEEQSYSPSLHHTPAKQMNRGVPSTPSTTHSSHSRFEGRHDEDSLRLSDLFSDSADENTLSGDHNAVIRQLLKERAGWKTMAVQLSRAPQNRHSHRRHNSLSPLPRELSESMKGTNDIRMEAKKVTMFCSPFIDRSLLKKALNDKWTSENQWDSPEGCDEGVLREILETLPPKYADDIRDNNSSFIAIFSEACHSQKRASTQRIKECSKVIFGVASHSMTETAVERKKELLGMDDSAPDTYKEYPPVLFPLDRENPSELVVFRSEYLLNVACAVIFGSSTVLETEPLRDVIPDHPLERAWNRSSSNVLAKQWGTNSVSPGFIAFMAILTVFHLSPDPELRSTSIGAKSGIDYKHRFYQYKEMLSVGLESERSQEEFRTTMKWWNAHLFPAREASAPLRGGGSENSHNNASSEQQHMLAAIRGQELDNGTSQRERGNESPPPQSIRSPDTVPPHLGAKRMRRTAVERRPHAEADSRGEETELDSHRNKRQKRRGQNVHRGG